MKELYYYEWSDDRIDWRLGEIFFDILPCVNDARDCPYAVRFKKIKADFSDAQDVHPDLLETARDQIYLLEKLLQ